MSRWLRMIAAELPLLRNLPDLGDRPLPRVEADLGPSVPGWSLRVAVVLTAGTMVVVASQRATVASGLAWTLVVVAVALMTILPAAAHGAVVLSGLLIAAGAHGPFDPIVFALIPLAYAAARLAWWAERAGLTARVEIAALTRGLPRAIALTSATAGFGAVVFLLAGRPNPVAVLAGGAALVLLVSLMLVLAKR